MSDSKQATATILVVDDTPDNLTLMSGLLKEKYYVKVASSGEKALRIAQSENPPDLILLDIMMPDIDGYEVCRRLQQDPKTCDIPVIFLTAKSQPEDEAMGIGMGAVDYIIKPISPPIVLARVRNHLALTERTATLKALSDKLSKYFSPQVYQAIFDGTQDVKIETKRKKLTIFFSDIKDFTETTEGLEPEDLTLLLNEYFSEMSQIAQQYGATIDKFIGDAMLIFLGDPQTLGIKEDALQCVRMAVAMQQRMAVLQKKWRENGYLQPFHMRIGINTGYCDVGNFGSEYRMDYTIIGAQVNLAARLEQAGDPDGIMLSHETYELVQAEFVCEEREPVKAKGVNKEIRCFSLQAITRTDGERRKMYVKERVGMRLLLNFETLSPESRQLAIEDLQEAVERIRKQT
ncbi:MAG: adenylate/guanylate cyclase domain-containing protein [Nitrosomonadales bacterium]